VDKYIGTWSIFKEDLDEGLDKTYQRYSKAGIRHVAYGGIAHMFDIHKELYAGTCIDPHLEVELHGKKQDVSGYTQKDLIDYDFLEISKIVQKYGIDLIFVITPGVSEGIAKRYPETAVTDVYGNRSPHWLCPSNPDVRGYFLARIKDILLNNNKIKEVEMDVCCLDFYDPQIVPEWVPPELFPLHHIAVGNCFCQHCRKKAEEMGLSLKPIRGEIKALMNEARELSYQNFKKQADTIRGAFDMVRFILNHPKLIDWLKFRSCVVNDFLVEIKKTIQSINKDIILSNDLTSPSFSWKLGQLYSEQSRKLDLIKLMLYHKRIGSFEVKPLRRIKERIPEIKDEELMEQYYRLKGFSGPSGLDKFEKEGVDVENIYYEVRKAKAEVGSDCPIVAGLVGDPPATTKDVAQAVEMAWRGGCDGYMLHQWYGSTPKENIEAFGEKLKQLGVIGEE